MKVEPGKVYISNNASKILMTKPADNIFGLVSMDNFKTVSFVCEYTPNGKMVKSCSRNDSLDISKVDNIGDYL